MNIVPVKTPRLIKGIFPNYAWNMPDDKKVLYLTFDDGPTSEITPWTLEILKDFNAQATFFCIGNNIASNPSIVQDVLAHGHTIGNHTFDHARGWKTKTDAYIIEAQKTQKLIEDQLQIYSQSDLSQSKKIDSTKYRPLFRPPYGQIKLSQGKQLIALGYHIIMWDIIAFDWKTNLSGEQCAYNVISKAVPGSIVVFHDSVKAFPRMKIALQKTLEHFSKQGYVFKSLPLYDSQTY